MGAVVTTAWRRAPRAVSRITADAVLLLLPEYDAPRKLQGAAALVFDTLTMSTTTEALIAAIATRVERAPEEIVPDVMSSLEQLASIGAIEAVTDA